MQQALLPRHWRLGLACAFCLIATACRGSVLNLGQDSEQALRNADALFGAFALRYDSVRRDSAFEHSRLLLARYALIPSRLYSDSSLWTVTVPSERARVMYVRGFHDGAHYRFVAGPSAPVPERVGEQRHFMRLQSLGRNDYEWTTSVEHAIGHVRPAEVAAAVRSLLTAAEGRSADSALADARASFPAAATVMSRLVHLDSLRTFPMDDRSTTATLGLRFTPDGIRDELPAFARWIDKYVMPSVYDARWTSHAGDVYVDVAGREGRLFATLRSRDGRLLPLRGGDTPLPDSLWFTTDFSARYGPFRIGYRRLTADFTIERGEHETAWMMRWRREPEWHFPLAFDKLIRNPLRRPFDGPGIELRLGVRDDLGPQTLSIRATRLVVNESGVMRWLGGLGATAFGDFSGRAERDENRFMQQLFSALRDDLRGFPGP